MILGRSCIVPTVPAHRSPAGRLARHADEMKTHWVAQGTVSQAHQNAEDTVTAIEKPGCSG